MRLAALILPICLLCASEAGPLRRPVDDRGQVGRPRAPQKWPRQFSHNGTTTPTPAASSTTTALGDTPLGLTASASAVTPSPFLSSGTLVTPSTGGNSSSAAVLPTAVGSGLSHSPSSSTSGIAKSPSPTPASRTPGSASQSALSSTPSTHSSRHTVTGSPNSGVPTAIKTAPPSVGTISPEVYEDNLRSAREYNALFATITEQSACSPNQAACVGGDVAQCASDGSFHIVSTCGGGAMCYALPLNSTNGVALTCADTATAKAILGSLLPEPSLSSFSGPTSAPTSPRTEKSAETTTVTQTVPETTVTVRVTESAATQSPAIPVAPTTRQPAITTSAIMPTITSSQGAVQTPSLNTSGLDTFITKSTPLNVIPVTPPTTVPMPPAVSSLGAPRGNNKSEGAGDPAVTVFITVTRTEKDIVTTTVTAMAIATRS